MEVLTLVPNELRDASYALGVSKWQTVLRVVLPTSFYFDTMSLQAPALIS